MLKGVVMSCGIFGFWVSKWCAINYNSNNNISILHFYVKKGILRIGIEVFLYWYVTQVKIS